MYNRLFAKRELVNPLTICGHITNQSHNCSYMSIIPCLLKQACSTSPPGGNQVDGLPPVAHNDIIIANMTRRADFCRRVTLYTRSIRRGGRKDTRLGPKLYMRFASSFVTCSGYMYSFGLRFCLGRFVVMLKPMVATAKKVIEQRKIVGEGKVRHKCWNMTLHEKC